MLIFGLLFVRISMYVVTIPKKIILPIIVVLCTVGSYAESGNIFNVYVMFVFGVIGLLLRKFHFSIAALMLGFVLGPFVDENVRRSIILANTGSDVAGFLLYLLSRPISSILIVIIAVMFLSEVPWIRDKASRALGKAFRMFGKERTNKE
jgi:putative tricarboxylic transport membrane protein